MFTKQIIINWDWWRYRDSRVGDLGGLGGRSPPKFAVGDGPCIGPPPQIFREVVLSDVCERMNRVKNCLIKEFFSEIVVFLCRKGRIGYLITVNKGKSEKPGRWLKKRSSEILGLKMDTFSRKNRHFRNFGPRKFFPSPQTRRQVSAAALDGRPYLLPSAEHVLRKNYHFTFCPKNFSTTFSYKFTKICPLGLGLYLSNISDDHFFNLLPF